MGLIAAAPLRILEIQNEVMRLRLFGGGNNLFLACISTAIEQVVPHRAMQQRAVLLHHADMAAQAVLTHSANILAIDQDLPRIRVVEPQKQLNQGRFTRTRR